MLLGITPLRFGRLSRYPGETHKGIKEEEELGRILECSLSKLRFCRGEAEWTWDSAGKN